MRAVFISIEIVPKTSEKSSKKKASKSLKMPPRKFPRKRSKKASWKSFGDKATNVSTSQKNSETHTKAVVKSQSNATCVICKRSFVSEKMLNDHNTKHHYIRHCPNCPKTFRQTRKFILHLRSHLNDNPYQCKICMGEFNQKTCMLRHKKMHNRFIRLQCKICSEVFLHFNSFTVHKQAHSGPPYPCSYCDVVFSNYFDRIVHYKNHLKRCDMCRDKVVVFPTYLGLVFHMRFAHKEDVAKNVTVSTSEPCASTGAVNLEEDGESDSMDDLLSSDDESLEDIDYNYQKDAVESVYTLKRKDKFICFICYDLYPSSELLKSHMEGHTWFPCNFCPKFFVDPETLHNHKCDFTYFHRADVNCSTEIKFENCEKTVANDVASHLDERNDRESMNDLLSSDSESDSTDIYYKYQKVLFQNHKCDSSDIPCADVNCSTGSECENCEKTSKTSSILSTFQDIKYDIMQLINFIEYVKSRELPLDVTTLNHIALHVTCLQIILNDSQIRRCFPSEWIPEIEEMYFKLQDFNQSLCDRINHSSEQ